MLPDTAFGQPAADVPTVKLGHAHLYNQANSHTAPIGRKCLPIVQSLSNDGPIPVCEDLKTEGLQGNARASAGKLCLCIRQMEYKADTQELASSACARYAFLAGLLRSPASHHSRVST